MSYWNYRIIEKHHEETDTNTYHIHEVYYTDDGAIEGWTESAVEPMGETIDELREDIRFFLKAFQKPILKGVWLFQDDGIYWRVSAVNLPAPTFSTYPLSD